MSLPASPPSPPRDRTLALLALASLPAPPPPRPSVLPLLISRLPNSRVSRRPPGSSSAWREPLKLRIARGRSLLTRCSPLSAAAATTTTSCCAPVPGFGASPLRWPPVRNSAPFSSSQLLFAASSLHSLRSRRPVSCDLMYREKR